MTRFIWIFGLVLSFPLLVSGDPSMASVSDRAPAVQGSKTTCSAALLSSPAVGVPRSIEPLDLAQLIDFGGYGLSPGAEPAFALSPDGRWIAVQLRKADPVRNTYCLGVALFPLSHGSAPVLLDQGGELVRDQQSVDGLSGFPAGTAKSLAPAWSADGSWIAFLRRDAGVTQLWLASQDGRVDRMVTSGPGDVERFEWSADDQLTYFRETGLANAKARIVDDAPQGYLYDERYWALSSATPFPRGTFKLAATTVQIGADGSVRSIPEAKPRTTIPAVPAGALASDVNAQTGEAVWITEDGKRPRTYLGILHLRNRPGGEASCAAASCATAAAVWLGEHGSVLFLGRYGFAQSETALFRWDGQTSPQRILATSDLLGGCVLRVRQLLCAHETSLTPRNIVSVNIDTGKIHELLDFNPQWKGLKISPARRLRWKNRFGLETIADLVLPPDHRAGQRHPLIVVTYETRGFLRGATGDEYPIQAMAANGFAVLSFNRPLDYDVWLARRGIAFSKAEFRRNWMDRQSVQDSLVKGVRLVEKLGVVDPSHIAVSGLSDGASTAEYALIHSRLFSLALLSTCCEDPAITNTEIGPAYHAMLKQYDYPLPWERWTASWDQMNLAAHAGDVCAPLFIQASDAEFRMALSTYQAWKDAARPVTMYVYPDEFHIKWQPAHRLMIYERNIERLKAWAKAPRLRCN